MIRVYPHISTGKAFECVKKGGAIYNIFYLYIYTIYIYITSSFKNTVCSIKHRNHRHWRKKIFKCLILFECKILFLKIILLKRILFRNLDVLQISVETWVFFCTSIPRYRSIFLSASHFFLHKFYLSYNGLINNPFSCLILFSLFFPKKSI